ncbi:MAG: hypothetical protein JNJ59_09745 [Deltaproteobacteria bacterium]|nr:hypothetical protein [Deltaproteobacteria bacterium]
MFEKVLQGVARNLLVSGLAAGAMGCSGGGKPGDTRAVAESFITALDRGDPNRFVAVLPPEDRLGTAFDCGRADTLRATIQRRREDARSDLEARKAAGLRVKLTDFQPSEPSELGVGDVFHGCTVKASVGVQRAKVTFTLSRGGRADDVQETWTFVRFEPGGPWYYMKL